MNTSPMAKMYEVFTVKKFKASVVDEKGYDISRGYILINERPGIGDRVGIIEDIWTDENHRRKGLASEVVQTLIDIGQDHKVYKIVLDCADHNVHFYEKFGFHKWQNSMRKDF